MYFSHFQRLDIQDQGASGVGVWREPSSELQDYWLATVASRGKKEGKRALWDPFYEGTNPIHEDPALMT